MKYVLVIADKKEQVVMEYHNVELVSVSKDGDMLKMRYDVDWEYSHDSQCEHNDYIMFSVFRDGTVNKYEYEWNSIDDDLFLPSYICADAGTYKLVKLEKMGD